MIDIHCHILPGLDDGPKSMETSVAMARMSYEDGTRTLVATPHIREGFFTATPDVIQESVESLRVSLMEAGVEMEVLSGADVRIYPEMLFEPSGLIPFTLGQNGRYFLLEFADELLPPGVKRLVEILCEAGLTPIITHPERNFVLTREPQQLYELVLAGALVQVTASALAGRQGPLQERYIRLLMEHRMVHFLGTDAHSLDNRPPILSEGLAAAKEILGAIEADRLVRDNPQAVLSGNPVEPPVPQPFGPPTDLGRFSYKPNHGGWFRRLLGR